MKVRSGGKSFEIPDERVRGGVVEHAPGATCKGGRAVAAQSATSRKAEGGNVQHAGSNPAPAPKYDSKWEERYATMLDLEQKAGNIVKWWYHPWHMRIPGGARYELDFLVQHHGHLEAVDVKGWHKNIREAMLRIKVAASIYTCYTWHLAKWNGKDFDYIPVEVDPW